MRSHLIGKEVIITAKDSYLYGEWGIIRYYDGDYYYISPWGGEESMLFDRKEFKVKKNVTR